MQDVLVVTGVILLCIAIVLGIAWLVRKHKRQQALLEQLAANNGWSIDTEIRDQLPPEVQPLNIPVLANNLHEDRVSNLIRGTMRGRKFTAFKWRPHRSVRPLSDIVDLGIVIVERSPDVAQAPDFNLSKGHWITDTMSNRGAKGSSPKQWQPISLPSELAEWRIHGVAQSEHWFQRHPAEKTRQKLDDLDLPATYILGSSGDQVYVYASEFDAPKLKNMLEKVRGFSDVLDSLD